MTLSVTEAFIGLNSSVYKTPSALQQLAMDLSVEASGKVTVLYGQPIDVGGVSPDNIGTSVQTSKLAAQLAKDPDIRIINKTAFAEVVSSLAFERAIAEAHGCTLEEFRDYRTPPSPEVQAARNFLNDAKNGIWAKGSERFTMETKGAVETLSFNADPT